MKIPESYYTEPIDTIWLVSMSPFTLPHEIFFECGEEFRVYIRKVDLAKVEVQRTAYSRIRLPSSVILTKARFVCLLYLFDPNSRYLKKLGIL